MAVKTISANGHTISATNYAQPKGTWQAWSDQTDPIDFFYIVKQDTGWWKIMGIGDLASQHPTLTKAMAGVAGHLNYKGYVNKRVAEVREERKDS